MSRSCLLIIFVVLPVSLRSTQSFVCHNGTSDPKPGCVDYCSATFQFAKNASHPEVTCGCSTSQPSCTKSAKGVTCRYNCSHHDSSRLSKMAKEVWKSGTDVHTTKCESNNWVPYICPFPGERCYVAFERGQLDDLLPMRLGCAMKPNKDCDKEGNVVRCRCKNGSDCTVTKGMLQRARVALGLPVSSSTTMMTSSTEGTKSGTHTAMHATSSSSETALAGDAPPSLPSDDNVMWIVIGVIASVAILTSGAVTVFVVRNRWKAPQNISKPSANKANSKAKAASLEMNEKTAIDTTKGRPLTAESRTATKQSTEEGRQTTSFSQIVGDTTTHDAFA